MDVPVLRGQADRGKVRLGQSAGLYRGAVGRCTGGADGVGFKVKYLLKQKGGRQYCRPVRFQCLPRLDCNFLS